MANHCRIHSDSAIAALNAIVDRCDAGGAGDLILYTGAEPAYADDAAGTEVATCALAATAYGGAAADGANHWADADLAATATDADATGNGSPVAYFRLVSGGAAVVLQGTIGTSGCDLNLNTTTIATDSQVDITSLEVRVPYNQA
ncbi:MAG TPA: hypothetical protein VFH61_08640 [Thermoleophilia bacterium]|nr:hypothetical protein [Thermoleophilia bacterium]